MLQSNRILSIDAFRASTMFLMIFVNDLWTLFDVPTWLLHATIDEDRLGLSDWVFPGFLFIVGLSIPFAIKARQNKNDSKVAISWHILKRGFALILMGFFMVNLEHINKDLLPISKYVWQILMATAIVLIWNAYPNNKVFKSIPVWILQFIGVLIFVYLSVIYVGGPDDHTHWLQPHWWGILGIIGWSYTLCALLHLIISTRLRWTILLVVVFYALNVLESYENSSYQFEMIVSASNYASVMTGVLITILYLKFRRTTDLNRFFVFASLIALILILFGLLTRPEWGISKLKATPSWTSICAGISIFLFLLFFFIIDLQKRGTVFKYIAPAGRSTLTCYLMPYFYYAIMMLIGVFLPESLRTGFIGIIKSLAFAFLIIWITGLLEKIQIRLKV